MDENVPFFQLWVLKFPLIWGKQSNQIKVGVKNISGIIHYNELTADPRDKMFMFDFPVEILEFRAAFTLTFN